MGESSYTGYKTAKHKLFVYTKQDKEGWFFFINRFDGSKLYESTQRFECGYQANDSGCHFVLGYQLACKSTRCPTCDEYYLQSPNGITYR